MSNTITLYWSVPVEVNWEEYLSLTGSATVLYIWWKKILVDLWLFQWWKASDFFNQENQDFLEWFDAIIISHPHIDHVWRLPLLYRNGFRWKIYMTKASKRITKEMLVDTLKIEQSEKEERLRRNNKIGFRLRKALKIRWYILALQKNNFWNDKEKSVIEDYLKKTLWRNYNKKEVLNELKEYLDFYKIKKESDISDLILELNKTLFTEEEMWATLWLIQGLEYSEEEILFSKKISSKNKNTKNQELLENLPKAIVSWYNEKIYVQTRKEKKNLKDLWKKRLANEIEQALIKNKKDIEKYKAELKKQLEIAYLFCYKQYAFLTQGKVKKIWLNWKDKDYQQIRDSAQSSFLSNKQDFHKHPEYRLVRKKFNNYKKLLDKYNIQSEKDIDLFLEDKERIIDILNIDISFNSKDIEKATHLLQVKRKKENKRIVTWFSFTDAAHIVGSASINIISWEVRWKVNDLLDINWDAVSVFLSGDLWRIKDNRLWKPELPEFPVNHLQIESTYAWKEHRDRKESVKDLMNSIKNSKWDVLISVFAQHRLQEILMTILEELLILKEKGENIDDYEMLLDTPLWEKLTDIYIEYEWWVFNLLKEDVQKKLFWKVMFRFLGEWEREDVYNNESNENNEKKKRIILSSSGMMEWWAIKNHLTKILEDPNATLLSPWFLCYGTLWHKIVINKDKVVGIWWWQYEVKCNSKFIDWFSSHISHSEILEYITNSILEWKLKLDSTISLNHWNREWQELLKQDIEAILEKLDRKDIKVIIPSLYDVYNIETRKIKKDKKRNIQLVKLTKDKIETPIFLFDSKQEKELEEKDIESEEVKIARDKNNKLINKLWIIYEKVKWKLLKARTQFTFDFFSDILKKYKNNKLFHKLSKLDNLWKSQKKDFLSIIKRKIQRNKQLKYSISTLKDKINNINILLDLIREFKDNIDYTYPEEIKDMEDKIDNLNQEIKKLENSLNNYTKDKNEYKSIKKYIRSKKRRIRYLRTKIKELNYIITWDTSNLMQEISFKRQQILKIKLQIKKIREKEWSKTKKDKEVLKKLSDKIVEIKKQIRKKENKIQKISNKRSNFEERLKRNIKEQYYKELSTIFEKLWNSNEEEIINELQEFCDFIISEIKSDITVSIWELHSHIDIKFKRKIPNFNWRDLYTELVEDNNQRLDIKALEELIEQDFFSIKDKQFLENNLREYKKQKLRKKVDKKLSKRPIAKIKKFLKRNRQENNDLWIDFSINIGKLNDMILSFLWNIFEKEYFDDFIYPNFDIYRFLKSAQSLEDFIKGKYNLEKLKGIWNSLFYYEKKIQDLEDLKTNILRLKYSNQDAKTEEELEEINQGIKITKDLIDEV